MKKGYLGSLICSAVLVLSFLLLPLFVFAEIPRTMNYQGYLKDNNSILVDGTVTMKFCIWNAETGGNTPLWSETVSVEVKKGIYSVILGLTDSIDLPFDAPYYLGVTVGTDQEMSPRQPLSSVPYALNTELQSETDPTVPENLKDGVSWTEVSDRPSGLDDGDDLGIEEETDPEVGTNVMGYVAKWTGTALEKGTIYDNGNVGIGTTSPNSKLEVAGVIHSTNGGIKFPDGTTQSSAAVGRLSPWNVSGSDIHYSGGNIGIGTTSPTTKLYVSDNSANFVTEIQQASATGNGLAIHPSGSDEMIALGVLNSEGSTWRHYFAGNGTAILANAAGGSVGIGTTTPKKKLHIASSGVDSDAHLLISNSDFTQFIKLYGGRQNATTPYVGWKNNGALRFLTMSDINENDVSEKLRIDQNGNVGIGTTNPKGKLQITSTYNAGSPKTYDNYGVSIGLVIDSYQLDASGGWERFSDFAALSHEGGAVGSTIRFLTQAPSAVSLSERVRIDPNGNVGIGTNAPAAKLDILDPSTNGYVRFSPQDGAIEIGSGNDGGSLIDFHGSSTLSEDFAARIIHDDTTGAMSFVSNSFHFDASDSKFQTNGWISSSRGFDLSLTNADGTVSFDSDGAKLTQNITGGHAELDFITPAYDNGPIGFAFYKMSGPEDPPFEVDIHNPLMVIQRNGNVGIGTTVPTEKLQVNGNTLTTGMTTTKSLKITGGADIAEPFKVGNKGSIKPGMVLSIDPDNTGELKLSEKAYDRCVAGIVSGAGGINTGMVMSQTEVREEDSQLVALTGRAYCYCDASENPIKPGDLLTTSGSPGYAMKVTDYANAPGAIIGKAMSALDSGKGLVLVLVALQ